MSSPSAIRTLVERLRVVSQSPRAGGRRLAATTLALALLTGNAAACRPQSQGSGQQPATPQVTDLPADPSAVPTKESDAPEYPAGISELSFLQEGWVDRHGGAQPGKLYEVEREPRHGQETEGLEPPQVDPDAIDKGVDEIEDEKVPAIGDLGDTVDFEFFDLESGRSFRYEVDRAELARASRAVTKLPDESIPEGEPATEEQLRLEDEVQKSWSNATDGRIRRAVADGFADDDSIYQRLADYGGCSATVLAANRARLVALTAAHCIFTAGNVFSTSKISPRRNGGASPTWGTWTVHTFGYYPVFLDLDCEDNWDGGDCIQHDIALVIAQPDPGATPPQGMGWGYQPKSFLDSHSKYRRGYPGCSNPHSPSGCTANNLYGDGAFSVGSFNQEDADGWNRRIRFSSDLNPGDSGSGLYYYSDGNPYVFGVTSAEDTCQNACTDSQPNHSRRITPQWFDFINSVVY